MKKIEYQAPKMEVVNLKYTQALLSSSMGESTGGAGTGFGDDEE